MRQFYLSYPGRIAPIHQTLSGEFKGAQISQTVSGQSTSFRISQTLSGIFPSVSIRQTASDESVTPPIPQPPFALSWSHYVFLIGLKEAERSFYGT